MQPIEQQSAHRGAVIEASYPSQSEIDRAVRRAHRLRARATAVIFRRIGQGIGSTGARLLGLRARPNGDELSSMNALAALRSSAEILRDNPDLDRAQRSRLVDVVLTEEAKLEALAAKMFRRGGTPSGAA